MKIRTFSFIIVCLLLMTASCKNTKKASQSALPHLTEDTSALDITVHTESVKLVDPSDRNMYEFYVIIGSFKIIENARKYQSDLLKEGFTPEILENEDGLFRISVGGYDEESAARAKIAGIRAAYKNYNDVWLLIRK